MFWFTPFKITNPFVALPIAGPKELFIQSFSKRIVPLLYKVVLASNCTLPVTYIVAALSITIFAPFKIKLPWA